MMKRFNVSILDYLGKYLDGVLVLISIEYLGEYYDATYFYNEEHLVLTTIEDFDNALGHEISTDPEYVDLIRFLISKTIPYNEIFNRLDFYIPKEVDE